MKKIVSDIELQLVYTDAKGLNWWQYANDLQFPRTRQLLAQRFAFGAGQGLEINTISDSIDQIVKAYSAANKAKAANDLHTARIKETEFIEILVYLQERILYAKSDDSILAHAAVYYVLDGEKVEFYDSEYAEKKKQILIEDDAARDFFLSKAKREVEALRERSKRDSLSSLKKNPESDLTPEQKASAYRLPS